MSPLQTMLVSVVGVDALGAREMPARLVNMQQVVRVYWSDNICCIVILPCSCDYECVGAMLDCLAGHAVRLSQSFRTKIFFGVTVIWPTVSAHASVVQPLLWDIASFALYILGAEHKTFLTLSLPMSTRGLPQTR